MERTVAEERGGGTSEEEGEFYDAIHDEVTSEALPSLEGGAEDFGFICGSDANGENLKGDVDYASDDGLVSGAVDKVDEMEEVEVDEAEVDEAEVDEVEVDEAEVEEKIEKVKEAKEDREEEGGDDSQGPFPSQHKEGQAVVWKNSSSAGSPLQEEAFADDDAVSKGTTNRAASLEDPQVEDTGPACEAMPIALDEVEDAEEVAFPPALPDFSPASPDFPPPSPASLSAAPSPHPASPSSMTGGWGGVLSTLSTLGSSVRSAATGQLDRLYSSMDPTADSPHGSGGAPLSPPRSPQRASPGADGSSSLLGEIDRTVDYASERLGRMLLGGMRRVEDVVKIKIEPIAYDEDDGDDEPSLPAQQEDEPSPTVPFSLPTTTSHLYATGLNTLEALGRTTAGLVISTKDRLSPYVSARAGGDAPGRAAVSRADLKKSFLTLFNELSGNDAIERLQIRSTEASIEVKGRLRRLPAGEAAQVGEELRRITALLQSLAPADCAAVEPQAVSWAPFEAILAAPAQAGSVDGDGRREGRPGGAAATFVGQLQRSIGRCVAADVPLATLVEDLRVRVDSGLPLDSGSLLTFMWRHALATALSAALFLLLEVRISFAPRGSDFADQEADEEHSADGEADGEHSGVHVLLGLGRALLAALGSVRARFVGPAVDGEERLMDGERRAAFERAVEEEYGVAVELLIDSFQTLEPYLRLAKYEALTATK